MYFFDNDSTSSHCHDRLPVVVNSLSVRFLALQDGYLLGQGNPAGDELCDPVRYNNHRKLCYQANFETAQGTIICLKPKGLLTMS